MPVAAVPAYLGRNFQNASPGLRFSILLPIWTSRADQENEVNKRAQARSKEGQELKSRLDQKESLDSIIADLVARKVNPIPDLWEKNDASAKAAWDQIAKLAPGDQERIRALVARQQAMCRSLPSETTLCVEGEAIAPFTTGLGNEHPLENGFSFLNPYGIPYLPGSGVKGVLRRAAEELASGELGESSWSTAPEFPTGIEEEIYDKDAGKTVKRPVMLSRVDVLFGREPAEHSTGHFRGALTFWDVVPEIPGDRLMVEIMTPHYTHYYQQPDGSHSPHDSGQPNPISFLTVPPGAKFFFCVSCDLARLRRLAPELAENGEWKKLLESAFEHAFRWVGFGAKTAVGYGAMKSVAPQPRKDVSPPVPTPAAPAAPAPGTLEWRGAQLRYDAGQQAVTAVFQNKKTAPLKGEEMKRLLDSLGPEKKDQLMQKRKLENVSLRVIQEGNMFRIVGLLPDPA